MLEPLTKEEIDFLYDCATDKLDDLLCGDWDAVRPQARRLHILIAKLLDLMGEADKSGTC